MAGNYNIHDFNDDQYYHCPNNDCTCHGTPNYHEYLDNYGSTDYYDDGTYNYDCYCGPDCYICYPGTTQCSCGAHYDSTLIADCPYCDPPNASPFYYHYNNGRLNVYEHLHTGVNQFVYQHDHTDNCACGDWPSGF
jgi:hypothetical protein